MVRRFTIALLVVLCLGVTPALAADTASTALPTSNVYSWVKAKEFVRLNLLTFKKSSKVDLLETFSEKRLDELQVAVDESDTDAIESLLTRYNNQKAKALELTKNVNDEALLEQVRTRTMEQQRTMTELQLALENQTESQQNVVRVQKEVANQVVDTVRVVAGQDEATRVEEDTKEIWYAPGTSGVAPPAGWTYEGGAKNTYAPGTSAGGTGGVVIEGSDQYAPGTSAGGTSGNATSNTVIEGNASSTATGTTSGGTGGQTVVGN